MIEPTNQNVVRRPSYGVWLAAIVMAGVIYGAILVLMQDRSADAYARGRAALVNGDREAVLRQADLLIATSAHQREGWLLKGLLLSRLGKLDEAIVYLEKSSSDESLAVEANTVAAECFYSSGRYLQAIQAADRALKLDPECLDARRWLAAAYYDLGAVAHAIVELAKISEEAPDDPKPTRLLGVIAMDGEQFPEAIQCFQETLKRDPHQVESDTIRVDLAECQLKLNQSQETLQSLEQCQPTATVLTLAATALEALSKPDEAHEKLQAAMKMDPKYVPAKLAFGKLSLDRGHVGDALTVLTEAVKLEPMNREAHFQLSQAARRAGDQQRADDALSRMQEIGALEQEFSKLHTEASKDPDNGELRYKLGDLARRLAKPKLARIWFRAALAVNPADARTQAALKQLGPDS